VGIDADPVAIEHARTALSQKGASVRLCVGNFRNIDSLLNTEGISEVDGILADLGWRMEQFSGNGKGFSFQIDEPLVMTYGDPSAYSFTARDIVNDWEEDQIRTILRGYGEERFSGRIARCIVEARAHKPINTTNELVSVITASVPSFYLHERIHPATRTFQALRIAVNDEFTALEEFIEKAILCLRPHGRLAIISFHSLEDRIVKHLFRAFGEENGTVLTKKPITPSPQELTANPRSRSSKLRIFQKT
jgi:16S rRNA (cytosine1402-N4)-methyltransferase